MNGESFGQEAQNNKECGCRTTDFWLRAGNVHHGGAASYQEWDNCCRPIDAVRVCKIFLGNARESAERLEGQVGERICLSQHYG